MSNTFIEPQGDNEDLRSKYVIYAGGGGISLPLEKGVNKKFRSKNMIYADGGGGQLGPSLAKK